MRKWNQFLYLCPFQQFDDPSLAGITFMLLSMNNFVGFMFYIWAITLRILAALHPEGNTEVATHNSYCMAIKAFLLISLKNKLNVLFPLHNYLAM